MYIVQWCDFTGVQRKRKFRIERDAWLEAEYLREVYDISGYPCCPARLPTPESGGISTAACSRKERRKEEVWIELAE